MKSMNYGNRFVTKVSGDNGIDGVIHEDKLGFSLITYRRSAGTRV